MHNETKPLNKDQSLELTEIYNNWHQLVFKTCRGFIRNFKGEEIEDLCQYCWEIICRQYYKYDPEKGNIGSWIKAVCKNSLINLLNHYRAQKRSSNVVYLEDIFTKIYNDNDSDEVNHES